MKGSDEFRVWTVEAMKHAGRINGKQYRIERENMQFLRGVSHGSDGASGPGTPRFLATRQGVASVPAVHTESEID